MRLRAATRWLLLSLVVSVLSAGRVSGVPEDNKLAEVQQPAEVSLPLPG